MPGGEISIITGGGTGLGAALAKRLSKRSEPVLIVGRRTQKLIETQQSSINPHLIRTVTADVSTPEGRMKIVDALKEGERVKSLIHNAAVLDPVGRLMDVTLEDWRNHMSINVEGPLFLSQALLPRLLPPSSISTTSTNNSSSNNNNNNINSSSSYSSYSTTTETTTITPTNITTNDTRASRILHISSGAANHPYQGWGPYCTSKASLQMISRVLAAEYSYAHLPLSIGFVRPGVVDTPMQEDIRSKSKEEMPDVGRFKVLKDQGVLMDPKVVARFIDWVLNEVDDVDFENTEWDVRDETIRHKWEHYL